MLGVVVEASRAFNEHPIDAQELILMGAHTPLKHRPSFAYEIRAQEVFAGSGTWTRAMQEARVAADEPVELFGVPLQKRDRRDQFDLKDASVANRHVGAPRSKHSEHLGVWRVNRWVQ